MPLRTKHAIYILGGILLLAFLSLTGLFVYVLSSTNPAEHSWIGSNPWPIACSTKGCMTTQDWARQYTLAQSFATLTGAPKQTPTEAFTTVIRQHLLAHAFLKSPITKAEAKRYREQVLRISDDRFLNSTLGLSADEYDRYVIMPFLQQEALRKTKELKDSTALYVALSKERFILLLPWHFTWDTDKGIVTAR